MTRLSKPHQHLKDRGWSPVYADMGEWRHPDLHFHWRTQDALRLEDERDMGTYDAVMLLGEQDEPG